MKLLFYIATFLLSLQISWGQNEINLPYATTLDSLVYEKDTIALCFALQCTIRGKATLRNCFFLQGVDFETPSFLGNVDFSNSIFLQNADFGQPEFSKAVNFNNNTFLKGADFSSATFIKKVNFSGSLFSGETKFDEATFTNGVNFNYAVFFHNTSFVRSSFGEAPNFEFAQLPDSLFLSYADLQSLKSHIFLNNTRVDSLRERAGDLQKKCVIFLYHVDVNKLVIDHEKFSLGFNSYTSYEERVSLYQQVIKKCQDIGMESSVKGFSIDLQKLKLEESWGIAAPLFIWFQTYWWDFGYERDKILMNTAIAFALSFALFFIGFRWFIDTYFPDEQLGLTARQAHLLCFSRSEPKRWVNRIKITVFYTALVFLGWQMDHSKIKYRDRPWTSLLIYLIFTIGLIHLAYLAAFVIVR